MQLRTPMAGVHSKIAARALDNDWQELLVPLRAGGEASCINALKDDARVTGFANILLSNL
jgi:hypothetical protein